MTSFIKTLDALSDQLTVQTIGQSSEGRDIYALFYFNPNKKDDQNPTVLIFCQQHGNEPSGKEAALIFARDLLISGRDLLNTFQIILIPEINPDGGKLHQKRNARKIDLNRDHTFL